MKRLLKYFLAALVVITGVFSQTADAKAFSYTYTVSFSAGGQGSINGGVQVRKASGNEASVSVSAKGDKIIVTGLEYGDVISCDAQGSVALNENSKLARYAVCNNIVLISRYEKSRLCNRIIVTAA